MTKRLYVLCLVLLFAIPLFAQDTDKKQTPVKKKKPAASKIYYGGNLGLSFGSYFRISIAPLIGYKVSPKASIGAKIAYEYIEDKRYDPKLTASNYGASIFTRYRIHPSIYAHAEFAYLSYQYKISGIIDERTWIPFLLVGGGYIQAISPGVAIFAEVLFDVLQDSNSPYEKWNPFISIGVGVGL